MHWTDYNKILSNSNDVINIDNRREVHSVVEESMMKMKRWHILMKEIEYIIKNYKEILVHLPHKLKQVFKWII